jgi:hypothetical protein
MPMLIIFGSCGATGAFRNWWVPATAGKPEKAILAPISDHLAPPFRVAMTREARNDDDGLAMTMG